MKDFFSSKYLLVSVCVCVCVCVNLEEGREDREEENVETGSDESVAHTFDGGISPKFHIKGRGGGGVGFTASLVS